MQTDSASESKIDQLTAQYEDLFNLHEDIGKLLPNGLSTPGDTLVQDWSLPPCQQKSIEFLLSTDVCSFSHPNNPLLLLFIS